MFLKLFGFSMLPFNIHQFLFIFFPFHLVANSTEFFQSLGCVGTVGFLFLFYLQALSYCMWFNVLFSTGVLY